MDGLLASELWKRSAGNPMYLRELVVARRAAPASGTTLV